MKNVLIRTLLGMALLLAFAGQASAQKKAHDEKLLTLLQGYERMASSEVLLKSSDDPQAALMAVYRDAALPEILRLQAINALAEVPDARVKALLKEIVASETPAPSHRATHRAINTLAHAYGGDAVEFIAPALTHKDPQVRLTAAMALYKIGGSEGARMVLKQAQKETDLVIKEEMFKLLPVLR